MFKKNAKAAESSPLKHKKKQIVVDSGGKDLTVIGAEALFMEFIVEHNLPLARTDYVGPLFRKMFPDSAIATKYACCRTKSSCVLEALASSDAHQCVKTCVL